MGFAYTIKDQFGLHFVTFTVHQWVDVFTRRLYADMLLESLEFCQRQKRTEDICVGNYEQPSSFDTSKR